MTPKPIEVNEVIISSGKVKVDPLVEEIIETYNSQRRSKPQIATAHYREKAKENGKYIMYMESIGYSIFGGFMANVAPRSNYNYFYKNSRAYVNHPEWLSKKTRNNRRSIPPSGGSTLNFFELLRLRAFHRIVIIMTINLSSIPCSIQIIPGFIA